MAAVGFSLVTQVALVLMALFLWEEPLTRVARKNERKPLTVGVAVQERQSDGEIYVLGSEGESVESLGPGGGRRSEPPLPDERDDMGGIGNILDADTGALANRVAVVVADLRAQFGDASPILLPLGRSSCGFPGRREWSYGRVHDICDRFRGAAAPVVGRGKRDAKPLAKMYLGSGNMQGACKSHQVQSVVKRRSGSIRACYQKRLKVEAGLCGKLTVRWNIGANGSVTTAIVTSNTVGDDEVGNCVVRVLRRMRFQRPESGTCVVQWPFVFTPGG